MSTFEDTLKPYIDPRWTFNLTVSIGPGWHQIVLDTHAKLVEIDPNYKILQIKEKFGGLRYYIASEFPTLPITLPAEELSYKTCEECGTTEGVDTAPLGEGYHWIITLCVPCREEALSARQARDAELVARYGEDDEEDE